MSDTPRAYETDNDRDVPEEYLEGNAPDLLAAEYQRLVVIAGRFSEHEARTPRAPGAPTVLELLSSLARDLLPHGPAPSLSDSLHALDAAYAAWQAEEEPFQRVQARRLAYVLGQLTLLYHLRQHGE